VLGTSFHDGVCLPSGRSKVQAVLSVLWSLNAILCLAPLNTMCVPCTEYNVCAPALSAMRVCLAVNTICVCVLVLALVVYACVVHAVVRSSAVVGC